jgi:glyoxylase-like metal-dependent hydrolase (beta-lactamase superfamily II)
MLLERFPEDTVVRPGHGPATTLGRELQTNPFLRELRSSDG